MMVASGMSSTSREKITCLLDEYRAPGNYEVEWNAKEFSSGMYYARFSNMKSQQTIKIIKK